MLSIPKYPEQYAQHFLAIFYLLCCAFQHHVPTPHPGTKDVVSGEVVLVQSIAP